jgi:hypothetical protein
VADDKIWLAGGMTGPSDEDMVNDVWCTSDGANWTQVTAGAPFEGRSDFTLTLFDNKLWVIGGIAIGGIDARVYAGRRDVWYSPLGAGDVNAARKWMNYP